MLTFTEARNLQRGDVIHQQLSWPRLASDCRVVRVIEVTTRRSAFQVRGVGDPQRVKFPDGTIATSTARLTVTPRSAAHFHLPNGGCTVIDNKEETT